MKKHIVESFKRGDYRASCLTAICGGDRVTARKIVVKELRELAKEGISNPLQSKVNDI